MRTGGILPRNVNLSKTLQNRFDKGQMLHLVKMPTLSSKTNLVATSSRGSIDTIFAQVDNISNTQTKKHTELTLS